MAVRPLYIFDLDGTISDPSHRIHFITSDPKDWDAFYAACIDDDPISETIRVLRALYEDGCDVEIWSGRSDAVRRETLNWLSIHVPFTVRTESLTMRSAGDHRDDAVLKKEWLDGLAPFDRSRLVAAFEDRQRVVDMWRAAGVTCYQVAPGNF